MPASLQLPLPLSGRPLVSRADLIVGATNARAVAFVDAWPDWPVAAAALHGPGGCGKTHLVSIWRDLTGAHVVAASELSIDNVRSPGPLAIEDVDASEASPDRDAALFAALESPAAPILLTGRNPPAGWRFVLPDLASRFAAIASLPLEAPDEAMLFAIARKLFADRQLPVSDAVIEQMLHLLERSPAAIREFVAEADAAALAAGGPVNLALVRSLIATREAAPA
ncbi:MAG: hypothetical protein ACREHV_12550 [Rhizomicrobium sp.]